MRGSPRSHGADTSVSGYIPIDQSNDLNLLTEFKPQKCERRWLRPRQWSSFDLSPNPQRFSLIAPESFVQRPKIVLVGPSLEAVSGVSTHLNHLFSSDLRSGFELLHFQIGSEGRADEGSLKKLLRLALSPVAFTVFCLRHWPDLVHLNPSLDPKSFWRDLMYLIVARLLRRKVIYQVHGGALPQQFFVGQPLRTALLRRVLRSADIVVLLAELELRAYREFVPDARLTVIANAIETKELARKPIGLRSDKELRLVYVGRLVETKGIADTIACVGRLYKEGRKIRLTIVGSGPAEAALRSLVDQSGLSERVSFEGALFGDAKDRIWRNSDVFAFPTFHNEGLPYSLLEAMAAGAVPVTTSVGAIPDVLVDGVHGLIVPARDQDAITSAFKRLDDDRQLLERLARQGRERILSAYSVDRLAKDFLALYIDLLPPRSS
eukprot:TRINITY_DN5841_c0_g1_i2.p1 TRINITY_DN5841_c0_g1~~TRINITY_DN5841_c0_g1_i2.p1  ORF type:complete len:436 (-),score=58.35 TRINITY_DN5841_c0_g1_i2:601-1908(-)